MYVMLTDTESVIVAPESYTLMAVLKPPCFAVTRPVSLTVTK